MMTFSESVVRGSLYGLGTIAANDMEKVIADTNYNCNHSKWLEKFFNEPCAVGVSGAVMAKTLGFEKEMTKAVNSSTPNDYDEITKAALIAINAFSCGHTWPSYGCLGKFSHIAPPIFHSFKSHFFDKDSAKDFLHDLQKFLPQLKIYEIHIGILTGEIK